MAKTGVVEFFREVRQEVAKVAWPTRRETTVTAILVFVVSIIMSLFFLVIDLGLSSGVRFILGLGN